MQSNLQIEKLDIRTVVLVGRQDFGRCPLAAHLPMALWPIAGRPALERLLDHLAEEGIRRVVVCSENDISEYIEPVRQRRRLKITTLNEDLSGGTAGCLRDAVGSDSGDLIMVFSGSMASPPPLRGLIESHHLHGADLTMVFNPGPSDGGAPGAPAEIYLCKPDVLRLIPAGGYSDIKEGLIPSILRAGGVVRPFVLTEEVGSFHDRSGYLHAVSMHLTGCSGSDVVETPSGRFQIAPQASIHRSARIWGPVAVGEQARILEGAVVVGPTVIGPRTVIGCDSVVVRSVLWGDASVGNRCEVFESVLGSGAVLSDRAVVAERTVVAGRAMWAREVPAVSGGTNWGHWSARLADRVEGLMERLPVWARRSPSQTGYLVGGAVILAAFLWSYWVTFADLYEVWRRNDEYSAGLLVPFLAAYALWVRRRDFGEVPVRPAVCAGIFLFVVAQIVRGLGLYLMFGSAERLSMLMSVVAVALLLLGWSFLRKLAPALLFLCLMLPWPNRVQAALAVPLQGWATTSAVFCLELAGYEVAREGNIITIGDTRVAVAEACNGLRMITAFVVISGLVVLLTKRTWWEKMLILISSLPIALLCNTLRLTVTAVAFTVFTGENVEKLFHDFGGYAMMPLALALVVGELWFLARLTTPPADLSSTVITRRQPRQMPDS